MPNLTDNLAAEGLHKSECKDCKYSPQYKTTKDGLLTITCVECNKTYEKNFNEEYIWKFQKQVPRNLWTRSSLFNFSTQIDVAGTFEENISQTGIINKCQNVPNSRKSHQKWNMSCQMQVCKNQLQIDERLWSKHRILEFGQW